jgi:hypothetical protein
MALGQFDDRGRYQRLRTAPGSGNPPPVIGRELKPVKLEPEGGMTTVDKLRKSLSTRPWLEPLAFVGLGLVYLWIVQPTRNNLIRTPLLIVIVLIPFLSNLRHSDRLTDLGLRFDNLWASAREVGLATVIGAIGVVLIGLLAGAGPAWHPDVATALLVYPAWGLVQQYAMQAFTFKRLRDTSLSMSMSAAMAALLFASLHWPNLALALVTLVGGYVWCRLFHRHPNLFTLALSHGWLAVLLRYSWPATWLHNLRIGPSFWNWTP